MAYLVFQFPTNIDPQTAIRAVADHFGASVEPTAAGNGVIVNYNISIVPVHIKQAVERVGAQLAIEDMPSNGVETNPAIAFGSLLNGSAAGNADAQSSAGVVPLQTAPVVSPVTSQTTPPAPSVPAPPTGNAAVAHTANVAPTNPASVEFDSTGLAWDERIHSGNKTKTPGGEWRTKKGTDKSLIKTVELELRAKHQRHPQTVAEVQAANAAPDQAAARAYAHAEALRVAGPQLIDDATLDALLAGQQFTMSIEQNEWYSVYYAKRVAAVGNFLAGLVTAPPVAPASTTPTGNEAAAQPASPSIPVVSPMAAVGTVAPAPTAPHVELDATGLPHDTRIHIGAKLKDTAGVWIQRHDVPGEQKLLIMAELRAAVNAPNADNAAQATNTQVAPASSPVAPLPPVVPVVSADDAGTDFAKMMQWIVANQMAGRITPTAGPEAAKTLGFVGTDGNGQLALMTQQIAYLPYVVQILQGRGAV